MAAKLTDQERDAILADIKAGELSRNAIARKYDRGVATITKLAEDAGLTSAFDRSATKKATEAAQVDLSARLIQQASRNAGVAEQILASFESMDIEEWKRVSAHSRGIVLGILQDKTLALAPPDDDGREERRSALVELFDLMRSNPGS